MKFFDVRFQTIWILEMFITRLAKTFFWFVSCMDSFYVRFHIICFIEGSLAKGARIQIV
jgi:hypothetical protein